MLYLARLLHSLDGSLLRNRIVETIDGCVNNIYPFEGEAQSMILIDEMCLEKKISHLDEGGRLYAYSLNSQGEPVLLK